MTSYRDIVNRGQGRPTSTSEIHLLAGCAEISGRSKLPLANNGNPEGACGRARPPTSPVATRELDAANQLCIVIPLDEMGRPHDGT
jgi:hypothetical protein